MNTLRKAEVLRAEVDGVVDVEGLHFKIRVRAELLFVDATAWFRHQHVKHLGLAADARWEGDEDFEREMSETAAQIEALLTAGRPLNQPGLWPQIRNRSLILPWSLDDSLETMQTYARRLVEFGTSAEAHTPEFLLCCREGRRELLVTERLRSQARYAKPFAARVVAPSEIQRRLEEAP